MPTVDQNVFNVVVAVAGALGGWWLNTVWTAVKDLQKVDLELTNKLASVEVLVAGTYIKRSDFEKVADALFLKLDKIDDKLDSKMDKAKQ